MLRCVDTRCLQRSHVSIASVKTVTPKDAYFDSWGSYPRQSGIILKAGGAHGKDLSLPWGGKWLRETLVIISKDSDSLYLSVWKTLHSDCSKASL